MNPKPPMTPRSKKLIKLLIRILIATGLLVWVFSQIDLGQFLQAVKTAKWQFLIAAWVVTVVIFWINSFKMQLILKKHGCNVGLNMLFGASSITLLYSMIIPGILSTGIKWYILKKSTGKGSNVLSGMVYNQLTIMLVMAVFGLIALMILNPVSLQTAEAGNQWLLPAVCGIILVIIFSMTLLLLNGKTSGKIANILKFLLGPLPANVRDKGRTLIDHIAVIQTAGARFHINILIITIIANLIGGVLLYILSARAANVHAPLPVLICLCAVVYILGRVPISVANLGVREATLVGFLALYSVEKSAALLMSMILFSTLVVMAAIGAIYQISWAITAKKSAQNRNEVFQ
jgi:uncharacterized membrane protein YbhN (UPF0104 family)